MAKKTISGARAKRGQRSNGCNPRHNNRDYLPSNADPNRQELNVFFAESTRAVTIEQIYDKLFQGSYEEWLTKEHAKGRNVDAPEKYIDKIRDAGDSRNKKREQYEIIWQIGDKHNTGWQTNREDFMAARELLQEFAEHLRDLPEVELMTPEKISDPTWRPKSDCCLIVTNMALHGDEHTPQIHMDFIPYCRGAKRGQKIQNAYAAAFEGMGYAVKTEELKDEHGNPVFKKDKDGNVVFKLNKDGSVMIDEATGAPVPDPVVRKVTFGSIDWIETQKRWLAERMKAEHDWDREYKGKNKFGDVTISEYVAEDNKRILEEQERAIEQNQETLDRLDDHIKAAWDTGDKLMQGLADARQERDEAIAAKLIALDNVSEAEEREREVRREIQRAEEDRAELLDEIEDLQQTVDTIRTLDQYHLEADELEQDVISQEHTAADIEALESFAARRHREEARIRADRLRESFKSSVEGMKRLLRRLFRFEEVTRMDPVEKRSPSLLERIKKAESKVDRRLQGQESDRGERD